MGKVFQGRTVLLAAILLGLAALVMSCSDLSDNVVEPEARRVEAHPEGWLDTTSTAFHGREIRKMQWQMETCKKCHGQDYRGAIANVSCLTCHPNTPEDCTTCHGGAIAGLAAPPPDIDREFETTARGVGAHAQHLQEGPLRVAIPCTSCHVVPDSLYAPGHVDSDLPAEVKFSGLAVADSAQPVWDGQKCSNVYCHGNFKLGHKDNAPTWTIVNGTQAACGTCHGLPPDAPHPQIEQCQFCHSAVVDAEKNIIDKTKHINGQTEFASSTSNR